MHSLTLVLTGISNGLGLVGVLLLFLTKHRRTGYALMAWSVALSGLRDVLKGNAFWAALDAGLMAWFLWAWWNSGGGDGTRRRLRRWARRFQGVRRTAPVAAP